MNWKSKAAVHSYSVEKLPWKFLENSQENIRGRVLFQKSYRLKGLQINWKNHMVMVAFLWVFQNSYFCRSPWMAPSKKCFTPQTLFVFYPKMVTLPPIVKKSFNQSLENQLVVRITKIWALLPSSVNLVPLFKIKLVHRYKKETSLSRFVIVLRNKMRSFCFEIK